MARPRRTAGDGSGSKQTNSSNKKDSGSTGGSSNESSQKTETTTSWLGYWKVVFGFICLTIAVCAGYQGYLETRVNTPFDDKKMVARSGLDVPERFWGSYRPGVYFGMKTRDPHSVVMGLMWYFPHRLRPGGDGVRHWCEQSDGLRYGWTEHDAVNFGVQTITDHPFTLHTSFIKRSGGSHGGEWTARIQVNTTANKGESVSLIWYTALDGMVDSTVQPSSTGSKLTGARGRTPGLGEFTVKIFNVSGKVEHESFLSTVAPSLDLLRETVVSSLRLTAPKTPNAPRKVILGGELLHAGQNPNFVATQIMCEVPCVIDIVYESGSVQERTHPQLTGDVYSEELKWHRGRFRQRFEDTFKLSRSYNESAVKFAQAALSNLLGGIGYFYGQSRVKSAHTKEPVPYWRAPLYTAVPSRSFFPRGFLWDEGFHGLLIAAWDVDILLDVMCHWFDLMNVEGWIPREQILGAEALAKVPQEFVVQRNTDANPPAFFLTLQYLIEHQKDALKLHSGRLTLLEKLYPRLHAWFQWYNNTQRGEAIGSYRWRGRNANAISELNPKTLTSGLDDYPRPSHPTDLERHVDLRSWLWVASTVMSDLSELLNRDETRYYFTSEHLRDQKLLDSLHWSEYARAYTDWGLHTDAVELRRPPAPPRGANPPQIRDKVRVTLQQPEYRFADSNLGYVSLFPFLVKSLDADSEHLVDILRLIGDPAQLWTPYGVRSLSKSAPMYMKKNTEHDPPYWRGQVWVNINYLIVRALKYYGDSDGPHRDKCMELYGKLRKNLVANIMREYERTGFLWEHYSDKTGEGQGCRPFNGWTALVLLLMAEHY